MSISELFTLLETVESRVNNYWNFYTIVILALVSVLMAQGANLSQAEAPFIALVVLVFFLGNFGVISLGEARILALEAEIEARRDEANPQSPELRRYLSRLSIPRRRLFSGILHGVVDLAVVLLIFFRAS
jgi:lysylphosphatidylglycerol synthetase-like protein (DUF2156 family)